MEFKKFTSIENSYSKEFIEAIVDRGFSVGEFVVQEKVHGANFSFWTDGKTIKCAKRTDFLTENDKFYNHTVVLENYRSRILDAFKVLKDQDNTVEFITIFGELFGGAYNHKEVPRIKSAIKIQKGILYSPENDFYAYDIKINGGEFLGILETNKLFEQVGFFYAKSLTTGSFEEALQYPNLFESKIPEWLGLPLLEDNTCEGVIIKPVVPKYFNNGRRIILKNKNEKWTERIMREKKRYLKSPLSPGAELLSAELGDYITLNRLYNVLSKTGQVTIKDMGMVLGLYCKDAFEDFMKEHSEAVNLLEKKEQKSLRKSLNGKAAQLIKKELTSGKY